MSLQNSRPTPKHPPPKRQLNKNARAAPKRTSAKAAQQKPPNTSRHVVAVAVPHAARNRSATQAAKAAMSTSINHHNKQAPQWQQLNVIRSMDDLVVLVGHRRRHHLHQRRGIHRRESLPTSRSLRTLTDCLRTTHCVWLTTAMNCSPISTPPLVPRAPRAQEDVARTRLTTPRRPHRTPSNVPNMHTDLHAPPCWWWHTFATTN
jgi:hypothetical protein